MAWAVINQGFDRWEM